MKGLIIKDILNLRKSLKTTLLMIVFFAVFAYGTNNPAYIITMVVLILSMMSITSMTYDDMAKWDRYALAMPISRKSLVMSKYILGVSLSLVSLIASFAVAYVFILPKSDMEAKELLLVAYLIFSISIVFISIMLPFIYKLGVEKTRLISIGILGVPAAIVIALIKMGLPLPSQKQLIFFLKLSPLITLIILFSSVFISYRIYKNKDI